MSQERDFDDVAFIEDSDLWPMWPVCPVKKGDLNGTIAYYKPNEVMLVNMFRIPDMKDEDMDKVVKKTYDSIEALVQDGWVVD